MVGVEIRCGEVEMRITLKREFFEKRRIPFTNERLRLGEKSTRDSCRAVLKEDVSKSELVIDARIQECGTKSKVDGEWLVYFNNLVLTSAVVPISRGSPIVRGPTTNIPIECHYKRKQRVSGEPLTPTWLPLTSTIRAFGLLHFSLRTMTDNWTSPRSSSLYQQGEPVFLEASVEAPLHPPLRIYVDYCVATTKSDPLSLPSYKFITNYGCLVDSVVPQSSSQFFPREEDNRLRFSLQAFLFNQESTDQTFISCHLKATLKQHPADQVNKACYFHRPSFRWQTTEGDSALCKCCDSNDCFRWSGRKTAINTEDPQEADTTVGPFYTFPHSYWAGHLSVSH
ncbi:zona pellucida sperm-binding protein 3-like [Lampris incognitus]|uniref:zona pellucida sperm-binding protein 3-like n=1 Tax=Lampris incognitus TaxID=2546036 RepID=UPI0024B5A656|nr:zona pellucida sperm-binding protein 3-like [Lampris incognitus]